MKNISTVSTVINNGYGDITKIADVEKNKKYKIRMSIDENGQIRFIQKNGDKIITILEGLWLAGKTKRAFLVETEIDGPLYLESLSHSHLSNTWKTLSNIEVELVEEV